jgi:hypothetical protein
VIEVKDAKADSLVLRDRQDKLDREGKGDLRVLKDLKDFKAGRGK